MMSCLLPGMYCCICYTMKTSSHLLVVGRGRVRDKKKERNDATIRMKNRENQNRWIGISVANFGITCNVFFLR